MIQCSALQDVGVKELFAAALKVSMRNRRIQKMKRRVCKII